MSRSAADARPVRPPRAPAHGNGFVNGHGYRLLNATPALAMSITMTTKFTSRFRRRNDDGSLGPAVADTAALPEAGPATGPTKGEATPDVSKADAVKSEAAAAEPPAPVTAKSEAVDRAAKLAAAPARMVEVEKKSAYTDHFAQAKAWMSNGHAYRLPAAAAAALVLALGAGYSLGAAGQPREGVTAAKTAQILEGTAQDLRNAQTQIGQLAAELKSIKGAVEGIKGEREKSRGELLTKQSQLSERVERAGQENATRIGRLAEQLDRIDKATARQTTERTDKADKPEKAEKVAAAPLPPAKPPLDVTHTGSIGDAKPAEKPDLRKTPLDGYVVRDYDDGYALIETRAGRYIDVAVGYNLPGVGKVEAIERRGRQWVVITPKGYIGER